MQPEIREADELYTRACIARDRLRAAGMELDARMVEYTFSELNRSLINDLPAARTLVKGIESFQRSWLDWPQAVERP